MKNCAKMYRGRKGKGFGRGAGVTGMGVGVKMPKGGLMKAVKKMGNMVAGKGVRSIMPAREGASGGKVSANRRVAANVHQLVRSY